MDKFLLSERYRLELHWGNTIYDKEAECVLVGAYFSGPVLSNAERINDNDFIMLDFYNQYIILTENVYVAKLSWSSVDYTRDTKKVILLGAKITHDTELNRVPKLKDTDYLVINTRDHEAEVHAFSTVYKTYVIKEDNDLCNFNISV